MTYIAADGETVVSAANTMYIPDTITTINTKAFFDDEAIVTMIIPDSVTSIGASILGGATALVNITLPFIGSVRYATTPANNDTFGYIFGSDVIRNENKVYTAVQNDINYKIPSTLRTITITDDTAIKAEGFKGVNTVTTVVLPEGHLTSDFTLIGNKAFFAMSALSSINVTNETTNILPTTITTIGESAFEDDVALTTITLPSALSTLGVAAFRGNTTLATVNFTGRSLTTFNNYIFKNDPALAKMTYVDGSVEPQTIEAASTVYVPDTITSIGNEVFMNDAAIVNIVIPNSVVSIGTSILGGAAGLKNITIPFIGNEATVPCDYDDEDKVYDDATKVFAYLFDNTQRASMTSVTQYYDATHSVSAYMPAVTDVTITNAQVIHYGTFYNVASLQNVMVSQDLTAIEAYAFYNTTGLQQLNGNLANLVTIGAHAFENSTITKFNSETTGTIALPSNVTTLEDKVFYNVDNITTLTIPASVTHVGDYTFAEMNTLANVTIGNQIVGDYMFFNDIAIQTLVIPADATSVGVAALGGCTALVTLTVPFVGAANNANSIYATDKVLGYLFGSVENALSDAINQHNVTYYIPKSLKNVIITGDDIISANAFENVKLEHVIFSTVA